MTDDNNEVEKGAIVRPTNVYCDPGSIDPESDLDWEIGPVEELRAAGISPCGVCFGEDALDL